jgi:hypothetical protein
MAAIQHFRLKRVKFEFTGPARSVAQAGRFIQPHKTPDSCLEMQGWPEGRHPCVLEDAPGSCRGSITCPLFNPKNHSFLPALNDQ